MGQERAEGFDFKDHRRDAGLMVHKPMVSGRRDAHQLASRLSAGPLDLKLGMED